MTSPSVIDSAAPHCALVVESNPALNRQLSRLFDSQRWKVQFARNNEEALSLASKTCFDLIITGERTSGKEDVVLLRRIRLVRPHTRLIILTDEFTPGDVLASIRERAFSYFSQPIETDRLEEIVRGAMSEPYWDDGIEILSATANWVRLSVRCDVLTANRLIQFYREASGMPEPETEEVAAAFREVLLNAIEHGAGFDPTKFAEISYVRTRRAVICRVQDPGPGFSLDELKHAALHNPEDDPFRHMTERESRGMRPGGFGILMARKMVDDLVYNEKGNEVLLIKYLEPQGGESQPNSSQDVE